MDPSLRLQARAARAAIASGAHRSAALHELLLSVPPRDRDAWVDELFLIEELPSDATDLPRTSVPYLPSGVDEILTMIREAPVGPDDHFVDLGSGLGRVAFLVHLLCGARASGLEIQEHLVESARARGAELGLTAVRFEHADVSVTDLDGSVFFLYDPFHGETLRLALRRLEDVARRRRIIVCAVGLELHDAPRLTARATSSVALTLYDSCPSAFLG